MTIQTQLISYQDGDVVLQGFLAYDDRHTAPRPLVLIGHQWGGRDDFANAKAIAMAELGYVGFAWDVYGAGVLGHSVEENSALMTPFMQDRPLLLKRLQAGLNTAKALPQVDKSRVAAVGFCFGALCALDLARAGEAIQGAVSFHGLLAAPPVTQAISARVLVLHGSDDPLAPIEHVVALREELNAAGAAWELQVYGGAKHAFAVPGADVPAIGVKHHAVAERRSLAAAEAFLAEVLA
jgi:dienelactone hydrolase